MLTGLLESREQRKEMPSSGNFEVLVSSTRPSSALSAMQEPKALTCWRLRCVRVGKAPRETESPRFAHGCTDFRFALQDDVEACHG